jgi:hypothetical protein
MVCAATVRVETVQVAVELATVAEAHTVVGAVVSVKVMVPADGTPAREANVTVRIIGWP